jgi:hypothetical protein
MPQRLLCASIDTVKIDVQYPCPVLLCGVEKGLFQE